MGQNFKPICLSFTKYLKQLNILGHNLIYILVVNKLQQYSLRISPEVVINEKIFDDINKTVKIYAICNETILVNLVVNVPKIFSFLGKYCMHE